jgi:hypothetical protein
MSRLLSAALLAALALGNALVAASGEGVTDQYRVSLRVFFRAFWCGRSARRLAATCRISDE